MEPIPFEHVQGLIFFALAIGGLLGAWIGYSEGRRKAFEAGQKSVWDFLKRERFTVTRYDNGEP